MGVQTDQSPGAAVAEPPPSAEADAAVADTRPLPPDEAIDAWAHVKRAFAALLRNPTPDAAWVDSLQALKQRMQVLARRDFDTALYLLMQDAAAGEDRYSAHHSLLCGLVAEVCADWYEWSPAEMDALVLSALSMNVSMSAMQDALTLVGRRVQAEDRAALPSPSARSPRTPSSPPPRRRSRRRCRRGSRPRLRRRPRPRRPATPARRRSRSAR
jgi:hypothetical protein